MEATAISPENESMNTVAQLKAACESVEKAAAQAKELETKVLEIANKVMLEVQNKTNQAVPPAEPAVAPPEAPWGYRIGTNIPCKKPGRKPGWVSKHAHHKPAAYLVQTKKFRSRSKKNEHIASKDWSQSGPPLKLQFKDLNENEKHVLVTLAKVKKTAPLPIAAIAKKAYTNIGPIVANYYTRNALRRLVRAGFTKKVSRGTYVPTKKAINSANV